jgi:hypothetical protein
MTRLDVVRHLLRAVPLRETAEAEIGNSRIQIEKSSFFYVVTPCGPVEINRRFGGTCIYCVISRKI